MYLETAVEAAKLGGAILTDNLQSEMRRQVSKKQQFDFVTKVDLLSEKAIINYIRERHPEHDILAEESGALQSGSDFQWIIDPLDGTKNYIHGFPFFSVSVALRQKNQLLVGAVLDPVRDELFYAEKGKGAFLNGQPLQVSTSNNLSECLIATGFPFRAKHLAASYFRAFSAMFHQVSDLRRAGSAALDLAYVACGRIDAFWEIGLNLWDIAAGVLLIEEAGGTVTDIYEQDRHLLSGHILASNSRIHSKIANFLEAPFRNVSL